MFSIVVATFNRGQSLAATLKSLLAQASDPPFEIIVVDNNSSDETRSIVHTLRVRAPDTLRYVFEGKQGLSVARNSGINAARGEIIAFTDDDVIVHPNWLQALVAAYQEYPDAACIGGKILLGPLGVLPRWFDPTSEYMLGFLSCFDLGDCVTKLEYPSDVWGANFSLRRDVISSIGLFNPELGAVGMDHNLGGEHHLVGEESDLCLRIQRAGRTIYYCGHAMVTHLVPRGRITKRFFRERAYWVGRTHGILFPQDSRRAAWKKVASIGSDAVGKWACALRQYSKGDAARAFESELKARSRLGYLHQSLIARNGRR